MKIVRKHDDTLEAVRIAKVGIYERTRLLLSICDGDMPLWLLNNLNYAVKRDGTIGVVVGSCQPIHALDYVVKDGRNIKVYTTDEFKVRYQIIKEEK